MYTLSNLFSMGVAGWCLGIGAVLLYDKNYKSGAVCAGLGVLNIVLGLVR